MINLAGVKNSDELIIKELQKAGIPIVEENRLSLEVGSTVAGQLGEFHFVRGWYHWLVDGPVPFDLAMKLYDDPLGRRDVRVVGFIGNISPELWFEWHDGEGKRCLTQTQFDETMKLIEEGLIDPETELKITVFPEDRSGLKKYISSYTIDSLEGLVLFVKALKEASLV